MRDCFLHLKSSLQGKVHGFPGDVWTFNIPSEDLPLNIAFLGQGAGIGANSLFGGTKGWYVHLDTFNNPFASLASPAKM